MEIVSLHSSISLSNQPCSCLVGKSKLRKQTALSGESVAFSRKITKHSDAKIPALFEYKPRFFVSPKASIDSIPSTSGTSKQESSTKEKDLVFVAGSTGRVGSRTVRELIKLGFRVRAGVRSTQRAAPLVQSVEQLKLDSTTGTSETRPAEKLEVIECDLEKPGGIGVAIGNAATVICCIGASEKEVFDVTGPYRIDYMATKNLIDAATAAKVGHFILLTSLGTNKIGFPAVLLNLFWGVLCWKRKAEEALIGSGLPYTIVRPGGMERPTDSFKETHNLVLASEDTYFGGLVSNLQVAELMACMAKNTKLSYCKVVEVIAETTAPLLPTEDLLAKIPSKREPPPELEIAVKTSVAELKAADETVNDKPEQVEAPKPRPLSPYAMFIDLKPPSSPSPSAPRTASTSDLDANGAPSAPQSSTPQTFTGKESKKQPLSPYPMYEDLKPPSSPSPSVPKL